MTYLNMKVLPSDVAILREMARKVRDLTESERNQECIRLCVGGVHNRSQGPFATESFPFFFFPYLLDVFSSSTKRVPCRHPFAPFRQLHRSGGRA